MLLFLLNAMLTAISDQSCRHCAAGIIRLRSRDCIALLGSGDGSRGVQCDRYRTNRSSASIVKSTVLIDATHLGPQGGHRLFDIVARIAPGETRIVRGFERVWPRIPGLNEGGAQNNWTFKDDADARNGCELDHVGFADGTDWELGTPI